MPTPFPGMDPYLERRGLWKEVHTSLIVAIQHFLTPKLRPRYRVAVEQRTYLALLPPSDQLVGKPDVLITNWHSSSSPSMVGGVAGAIAPLVGELPMPEEVRERYLEVRDVATQEVVTVIEILSPTNKSSKEGRAQYEEKRLKVLSSRTNLVKIDLLRTGKPFAMTVYAKNGTVQSHYRIMISRRWQRPRADLYFFNVRNPIPTFPIPLRPGEEEPLLPLNEILHESYDQGGYDMAIDYSRPPDPPLDNGDEQWAKQLIEAAGQ